jgi:hypothetical protein
MKRRRIDARSSFLALGCAGALLPALLSAQETPRVDPGTRIELESGLLWLPPGFARETQPYALQIHFHGGPALAVEGFERAGRGPHAVLLALHRDGFSKVYEQWLADEGWLLATLARVDAEIALVAPRARAPQISLSAFSAGYAAVRCLLRREADRARIRSVELADALHAGYDEQQRPLAEQMAPFVAFARDAAAGKARFLLTHSTIAPPGYASVAECAEALIEALGQRRVPDEVEEDDGLRRLSRATQGGFEVLGYAGDRAADHVRHFRRLWRPRSAALPSPTPDEMLAANAALVARCTRLARHHAHAWLSHADPRSGLLPRTLRGDAYWNARDCAADNLPFLALTGAILGDVHLRRSALFLLAQEQKLTSRIGALPDDFDFATQRFRRKEPVRAELVFGAAEYAKDGLAPWFEWAGPGPWLERMQALVRGVWDGVETGLPSDDVEVLGDLLQVCARLHWWTGDERYAQWTLRLADAFLVGERDLLQGQKLALRDHGCEVIGGLAEAYVLAAHRDPARREAYRPRLHALLDRILEVGRDERGLLFDAFDPRSGARLGTGWSDGYGYVYDAFLCVAELDGVARYRDAVAHVLAHLGDVSCSQTPGFGGADGHADAIESALNLLARVPEPRAAAWIEREMGELCALQREDGVLEGWYGDGNSARTALMVALWKTLGVAPEPWPEELSCAAVRAEDGSLTLELRSPWAWRGVLRFDRPRHRDVQHLPFDLARINQFPEWFTAERHMRYAVRGLDEGDVERELSGAVLWRLPLALKPGETRRIYVRALERTPLRAAAYQSSDAAGARVWQGSLREEMRALLRLPKRAGAFDQRWLHTELVLGDGIDVPDLTLLKPGTYELCELELQSTPTRRMKVLLTMPQDRLGPFPAVVCIHGHGGTRRSPYDPQSLYRGFAHALAREGFATIAVDVGQHEIYEAGGTLLGERLHDLVRCVDYLAEQENVDARRIGCAGLSLGGEMAMWLGALDERVAATVSCGFLTTMDQLEQGHCLCWKLEGLRERVDFADLYALTAPRALQCQNGLAEPPQDFCVPLAREAMAEIARTYADLGARERCELHVHDGGHVVDVEAAVAFLTRELMRAAR